VVQPGALVCVMGANERTIIKIDQVAFEAKYSVTTLSSRLGTTRIRFSVCLFNSS